MGGNEEYNKLAAWFLMLLMIWLITKTRAGYTIVYYSLVLMIVLVVLTQYQRIAQVIAPLGRDSNVNGGSGGGSFG